MSLPSSNWFSHWAVGAFANAPQPGKIQTRRRRTRRPTHEISLESLEPRQMLSVNPALRARLPVRLITTLDR